MDTIRLKVVKLQMEAAQMLAHIKIEITYCKLVLSNAVTYVIINLAHIECCLT